MCTVARPRVTRTLPLARVRPLRVIRWLSVAAFGCVVQVPGAKVIEHTICAAALL